MLIKMKKNSKHISKLYAKVFAEQIKDLIKVEEISGICLAQSALEKSNFDYKMLAIVYNDLLTQEEKDIDNAVENLKKYTSCAQ